MPIRSKVQVFNDTERQKRKRKIFVHGFVKIKCWLFLNIITQPLSYNIKFYSSVKSTDV